MPPGQQVLIRGEGALEEFRRGLTGERAIAYLRDAGGRLLVQLAVGVGKTQWMVAIIEHALTVARRHDLVIVLVPRWHILEELRRRLPSGLRPVVLHPRPRQRCGDLDPLWVESERAGCGLLGREELCGGCPRRAGCPWPGRHTGLRKARLILAPQQHLVNDRQFISRLCNLAGARCPLVLVDESDLLLRSGERVITPGELDSFIAAQQQTLDGSEEVTAPMRRWLDLSCRVAAASTEELQLTGWECPDVSRGWALGVQRHGRSLAGGGFRYLVHDFRELALSDPQSRERLSGGGLRFATPPPLGPEFIIFSGSVAAHLARYRLDPNHEDGEVLSPFAGHRFEHPGTQWYNLACWDGAARYFPNNATRIIDFFAEKVARNIRDGKRTLLVARKKFLGLCARHLRKRLGELGVGPVRVVTGRWDRHDLDDPRTLPLISYGVSGVNLFEYHDAAYCLSGYYIDKTVIEQTVYDIDASWGRFPFDIHYTGTPRRRQAHVSLPDERETILPLIVQGVFEQKEADVVVQAVGRVRPFTRPREVITFQAGLLPGVRYTLSFNTLDQARSFFGIETRRRAELQGRVRQAVVLKAQGYTRRRIAQSLGVSPDSVKRYLREGRGHEAC
jgi:hypothetical protein